MTNLTRFDIAQFETYETALAELQQGRKTTHWMWFIFPQIKALGRSNNARFYGIVDLDEARAYLADPDLGPRLIECAQAVLSHRTLSAEQIMGAVDAAKLRSSATLFREAATDAETREIFQQIITVFYAGRPCLTTLDLLNGTPC